MISINLLGEKFNTPLIPASGVFGYGNEYDFINFDYIGAYCTKGISLKPKIGNPTPRITETSSGVINSVGLQNIGVDEFLKLELKNNSKVIINFFGNTEEEYIECAKKLNKVNAFALEMNVSCPNIKEGGISFGQDPKIIKDLTKKVKSVITKPLIVKLTPNTSDITKIAKAAEEGGADAVSLINTLRAMVIDIEAKKPILGNKIGGLSGAAIKPVAIRAVYEAAQVLKIPIIGIGGISTARDVIEFFMAGASAVQVGSAIFNNPNICELISKDLIDYLRKKEIKNISMLKGLANPAF
jgi:dihydroorotate dehydrogenase (NAD+) catalytic subunit